MNGYEPTDGIPVGWSEWYAVGAGYRGYDYVMNETGMLVEYGHRPQDFLVDVIAHKAASVIRRRAPIPTNSRMSLIHVLARKSCAGSRCNWRCW